MKTFLENYIFESIRNVVLRLSEHENSNKQLEPVKHLKYILDHQFEWKVLTEAFEYIRRQKILQAF